MADDMNDQGDDEELEGAQALVEDLAAAGTILQMLSDSGPEHDQELFGFSEGQLRAVRFVRNRVTRWRIAALEELHELRASSGRRQA
jgi:hypothetical protein